MNLLCKNRNQKNDKRQPTFRYIGQIYSDLSSYQDLLIHQNAPLLRVHHDDVVVTTSINPEEAFQVNDNLKIFNILYIANNNDHEYIHKYIFILSYLHFNLYMLARIHTVFVFLVLYSHHPGI